MKTIEFTKLFTGGILEGLKVVERLSTDFPEQWKIGTKGKDLITGSTYVIIYSIVDD